MRRSEYKKIVLYMRVSFWTGNDFFGKVKHQKNSWKKDQKTFAEKSRKNYCLKDQKTIPPFLGKIEKRQRQAKQKIKMKITFLVSKIA